MVMNFLVMPLCFLSGRVKFSLDVVQAAAFSHEPLDSDVLVMSVVHAMFAAAGAYSFSRSDI